MATEKKLLDKFLDGCFHGPTTKAGCTIDASSVVNAVQDADGSPHDEDAGILQEDGRVQEKYFETLLRRCGARSSPYQWVDTNRGDTSRPNYRSRPVCREVKYDKRLDHLYSATEPFETLMFLCSMCARGQTGHQPYRFAVVDIKRAYFYALV